MSLSSDDLRWLDDRFEKVDTRLTALEVAMLTRAAQKGRNNGAWAGLIVTVVPWIIYLVITLAGHKVPPPTAPTAAPAPTVQVAPITVTP